MRFALLSFGLVFLAGASHAQTVPPRSTGAMLSTPSRDASDCSILVQDKMLAPEYFRLVNLYRTPDYYRSLEELRRVTEELVSGTVERMQALPRNPRHITPLTASEWVPMDACIEAATMMHSELALNAFGEGAYGLSDFHFETAYALIALIADPETHDRFFRNWLLALGYNLQRTMFLEDAEHASQAFITSKRYYDEAVRRFGGDAEVLLSAGTLYEWSGSMRLGEKNDLKKAEQLYARAVAADAGSAEAQLRYGRTLEKREKYREAEAPVARAIELDESAYLTYMARLMAGRLAERDGRLPEAIAHYEIAITLLPSWQVAHLALSHALHAAGRRQESRALLATTIQIPPHTTSDWDGWWVYELGRTERFEPLWERMREEIQF